MNDKKNDWRMQLFLHLADDWTSPWTGQTAPKGSQVTLVSGIKLANNKELTIAVPNATALCLNISIQSWSEAKKIRDKSGIDKTLKSDVSFPSNSDAYNYLEHVMLSVVMAFTALEAFVNETIPDSYQYHSHRKSNLILESMGKKEIERWLSLDEKLSKVLPSALEIKSPKGTRCWNGFSKLNKIRDRIIHMKKSDRKSSTSEIPTLWSELFKIEPPHKQAKEVIDHFMREAGIQYHWHNEYPKHAT